MAWVYRFHVRMEHKGYSLWLAGFPTTQAAVHQSALCASLTAILLLMFLRASARPTALTFFGNRFSAKNAKNVHEATSFSLLLGSAVARFARPL
jgi:hypothetical protein